MTNPNNAIGTNAAYGGRTSPNAFNDVLGAFTGRGILSGWECAPNTGMSVVLGGDGEHRDVAIAEDNAGNKLTINNISEEPIPITIAAAPASQSRIDAIVVYATNPPQGTSTATDNYGTVGVLDVQGATSGSPVAPNDSDIRTAITADGQSGTNAYYVVLAYVTVSTGTTDITSNMITQGDSADLQSALVEIPDGSITGAKLEDTTISSSKMNWSTVSNSNMDTLMGKTRSYTLTGTTDANGFLPIPDSIVTPSDGYVISARIETQGTHGAFCIVYNDYNQGTWRYSVRLLNYDLTPTHWTSTSATVYIKYFKG